MKINKDKPIIGFPFAAPLSGKDTAEKGLRNARPHIAVIHMSTLLQVVISENEHYKRIVEAGGLLPPEEAVRAFRRGFVTITKGRPLIELPHIFANGACREEFETKANMALIQRTKPHMYQMVGFRSLLDKEHILARAAERIEKAEKVNEKPRADDLGDTPVIRYETFHKNLGPVLQVFEKRGGILIDIDANETPEKVLSQIVEIYDQAPILKASVH